MTEPISFRPSENVKRKLALMERGYRADFINQAIQEKLSRQTSFKSIAKQLLKIRLQYAKGMSRITQKLDDLEKEEKLSKEEIAQLMQELPDEIEKIEQLDEIELLQKNIMPEN
jgi:hypothetical protein